MTYQSEWTEKKKTKLNKKNERKLKKEWDREGAEEDTEQKKKVADHLVLFVDVRFTGWRFK